MHCDVETHLIERAGFLTYERLLSCRI
jgi:hypothetical protein